MLRMCNFALLIIFIFIGDVYSQELKGDLIVRNVSIIDVINGTVASSMDISVNGERITEIIPHKESTVCIADELVDGEGQYIIPGLWDSHTHTWWAYREFFPLLMANGITGIREMWGEPEEIKKIRGEIKTGSITGPDIVTAGAIIDGNPPLFKGLDTAGTPERGRELVREQVSQGADFIKVYSFLNRDVYFAIADECRKAGIPFGGHIPMRVTVEEAVNAGQVSLEHFFGIMEFCSSKKEFLIEEMLNMQKNDSLFDKRKFSTFINRMEFETKTYNKEKLSSLISLLAESNSWLCPTLVATEGSISRSTTGYEPDSVIRYMPGFAIESWPPKNDSATLSSKDRNKEIESKWYEQILTLLKPMKDGGVKFLAGSDYPNPYCYPGFSLHEELRLFVEKAGFTPLDALQTATINPAVFFKVDKDLGNVETGKIASFLLLGANPLENINNTKKINAVILRGKFYKSDVLKDSLESVIQNNKSIDEK
ncbi:MAG: amidohydrolase family protein [Ignavibacteria bacterium]|nr:amidohydrolase family protein [Ignavibacteria bacterium]